MTRGKRLLKSIKGGEESQYFLIAKNIFRKKWVLDIGTIKLLVNSQRHRFQIAKQNYQTIFVQNFQFRV